MNTNNQIETAKYIPVRKLLKTIRKSNVCQKQTGNSSQPDAKTTLSEAA